MNWRDVFPATWDELVAMTACYLALPTVALMLLFPHKVMEAALWAVARAAGIVGA